MIACLWQATTRTVDFDAYWAFLHRRALADYQAADGNQGVQLFRRLEADRAHFLALSFWSSRQALSGFAGGTQTVRYYPEHVAYLVDGGPTVACFEANETAPVPRLPAEQTCVHCASTRLAQGIAT